MTKKPHMLMCAPLAVTILLGTQSLHAEKISSQETQQEKTSCADQHKSIALRSNAIRTFFWTAGALGCVAAVIYLQKQSFRPAWDNFANMVDTFFEFFTTKTDKLPREVKEKFEKKILTNLYSSLKEIAVEVGPTLAATTWFGVCLQQIKESQEYEKVLLGLQDEKPGFFAWLWGKKEQDTETSELKATDALKSLAH